MYVGAPGIEGLFLGRFGTDLLPLMYLLVGISVPVVVLASAGPMSRMDPHRVYPWTGIFMTTLLAVSRVLVELVGPAFYPFLFVIMHLMSTLTAFYAWGVAGAVTTSQQAKRIFPILAACGIVGSSVGALAAGALAPVIGPRNLIAVWAVLAAATIPFAARLTAETPRASGSRARRESVLGGVVRGLREVARSPLLLVFAGMAAVMVALFFLLLFSFSRLAVDRFADESSLASFFGVFQGAATATGFLMSLLLSRRLFAKAGLLGVLVGYALVFLAGFGVSIAARSFWPVVAFRYVQISMYLGMAGPAHQAVFNVVPRRAREHARLFVDGVLTQAGMLLAGSILLALGPAAGLGRHLASGLILSVAAVVLAVAARRRYPDAVRVALRHGGADIFERHRALTEASPGVERALLVGLDGNTAGGRDAEAALDALSRFPRVTDVRRLSSYAEGRLHLSERYLRVADVLSASPFDRSLLEDALRERARYEARLGLWARTLADGTHDHFALRRLTSRDPEERSYAVEAFESRSGRAAAPYIHIVIGNPAERTERSADGGEDISRLVTGLAAGADPWLAACALTCAPELVDDATVDQCARSESRMVRDAARVSRKKGGAMTEDGSISIVDRILHLRNSPIFANLTAELLESVAVACEVGRFEPGDVLDEEGAAADCMYVIVSGSVRILRGSGSDKAEIARRVPGDVIGEMSIISHRPRTATMAAAEPTIVLTLRHRAFEEVLRHSPEVSLAVMEVLCDRLVEAEDRAAAIKED